MLNALASIHLQVSYSTRCPHSCQLMDNLLITSDRRLLIERVLLSTLLVNGRSLLRIIHLAMRESRIAFLVSALLLAGVVSSLAQSNDAVMQEALKPPRRCRKICAF